MVSNLDNRDDRDIPSGLVSRSGFNPESGILIRHPESEPNPGPGPGHLWSEVNVNPHSPKKEQSLRISSGIE